MTTPIRNPRPSSYQTPTERVIRALERAGCEPREVAGGWECRCPAHDDSRPSLSIADGDDGRCLLHCHAGCGTPAIVEALGLQMRDLMPRRANDTPAPPSGSRRGGTRKPKHYPTRDAALKVLSRAVCSTIYSSHGDARITTTGYEYHHADGSVAGVVARWDWSTASGESGKEIRQLSRLPDGRWTCRAMPEPRPLYGLPTLLERPDEAVLIVEGEKCCDALASLGLLATTSPGGSKAPRKADWSPLAGRDVVILPDADDAGERYADEVADTLVSLTPPAKVRILRLPGLRSGSGDDVADWLERGGTREELRELVEAAAVPWEPPKDSITAITVSRDEAAVAEEVLAALGRLGWEEGADASRQRFRLYTRAGVLVHVVRRDECGRPMIVSLPRAIVRERISQACRLFAGDEEGESDPRQITPPKWLCDAIYSRGDYIGHIRQLDGIVEAPTLRPDGSLLQSPGYDPATRLLMCPSQEFPSIPQRPSRQQAAAAIGEILNVVCDFPFESPSDASGWLALVLTLIGRRFVSGPVPLIGVSSNVRGSGKTLLCDIASMIAFGRRAARTPFSRSDDEIRKQITATAIEARPFTLLDNIEGRLSGASLDAAITSCYWSDRILGQSQNTGDLPLHTVWAASGNNLRYGSDLARRVLPIRLRCFSEHPEDRQDFRQPNILKWVETERPRLVVGAVTVLRAFAVAGLPSPDRRTWGSFEDWMTKIRGAIVWAGLDDPCRTRDEIRKTDETSELLEKMICGLEELDPSGRGVSVRDIRENVSSAQPVDSLVEAVDMICRGKVVGSAIGNRLKDLQGRVWCGRYLQAEPGRAGARRWRVVAIEDGYPGYPVTRVKGFSETDDLQSKTGIISRLKSGNHRHQGNHPIPTDDVGNRPSTTPQRDEMRF